MRDLLSNMFPFQNYEVFGYARSGGLRQVQISWDICTRFVRYLYSTEWSWIISRFIIPLLRHFTI